VHRSKILAGKAVSAVRFVLDGAHEGMAHRQGNMRDLAIAGGNKTGAGRAKPDYWPGGYVA
jgi:hypothetical protein